MSEAATYADCSLVPVKTSRCRKNKFLGMTWFPYPTWPLLPYTLTAPSHSTCPSASATLKSLGDILSEAMSFFVVQALRFWPGDTQNTFTGCWGVNLFLEIKIYTITFPGKYNRVCTIKTLFACRRCLICSGVLVKWQQCYILVLLGRGLSHYLSLNNPGLMNLCCVQW